MSAIILCFYLIFFFNNLHADSIISTESPFLSQTRQLTFTGKRSGEGYFSHKGNELIYQSEQFTGNPFYQIYRLNLINGKNQIVSNGIGKTTCAWFHPNQNKVLFSSSHEDRDSLLKQKLEIEKRKAGKKEKYSWDYDPHYELYEKDLTTGLLTRLTNHKGYDAEASYSPDGQTILFSSNRSAYEEKLNDDEKKIFARDKSYFNELYLMTADGNETTRITNTKGYDGGPFFSADGAKICWRRFSENGHTAEIFVMSLKTKKEVKVTDLGVMSWAPFFHPSGKYIIFASNLLGFQNFELYIVDAQGERKPIRVTYRDGFDGLPSFSPDGKTVSWTSNKTASGNSQIFISEWNHEEALKSLQSNSLERKTSIVDTVGNYNLRLKSSPEIKVSDVRSHLEFLASKECEGRFTGSKGIYKAQEYVIQKFKEYGLSPFATNGNWTQSFPFLKLAKLSKNNYLNLNLPNTTSLKVLHDWSPLNTSQNGKSTVSEIVFAGFGIQVKKHKKWEEYDSFTHLDVKGKWIMVLRKLPSQWSQERKDFYFYNSTLRKKASLARDLGAEGIIFISSDAENDQVVAFNTTAVNETMSIYSISLKNKFARQIFSLNGRNFPAICEKLNAGDNLMGFKLNNFQLETNIEIVRDRGECRNILGLLKSNQTNEPRKTLVIGAHLDHIGQGKHSSRAKKSSKSKMHPGADDNASGIAALLEIAEFLSDLRKKGLLGLKYDILFTAWSGEEIGLIGSKFFANEELSESFENNKSSPIRAYLNMDMIGRYKEKLTIHGVGSSNIWRRVIQEANVPVGLNLNLQNDSHVPTDSTSFYSKGVPIISGFTGLHNDYHSPTDTTEKINYEKLTDTTKLFSRIIEILAQSEGSINYIADSTPRKASMGKLRSYLGTIPDYSNTDVKGVMLSGVSRKGPADLAGIRSKDVIVSLAGKKIETIYDYTDAISICEPNVETIIKVMRNGKVTALKIIPKSR